MTHQKEKNSASYAGIPKPSPNRFASSIRELEDLPTDGGAAVDTLAGGLLRTFILPSHRMVTIHLALVH
jgi:hypothetical protein